MLQVLADGPATAPGCAEEGLRRLKEIGIEKDARAKAALEHVVALASLGLAKDDRSLPCRYVRAVALQRVDLFGAAIPDWTACVKRGHHPAFCAFNRAIAHAAADQHEEAVEDYTRLLIGDLQKRREKEGVNRFTVFMNRGMSLCEVGRFDEAEDDFSQVEPFAYKGGQLAYWQLVSRYQGDKDKAMKAYLEL